MKIDLESLVRDFKVFVDTCTFMHHEAPFFFNNQLAPILLHSKKQLIIPHKVIIEIERLQKSKKKEIADVAKIAAEIMRNYSDHKLVDMRGEKGDPFADNVFHYIFSKFRTKYDLALLTQDRALAKDILALKSSKAVKSSRKLLVLKLDKKGNIMKWEDDQSSTKTEESFTGNASAEVEKFRLCLKPRQQKDHKLGTREVPEEGDHVDAGAFGRVRLSRILGEGGEGKIFSTDSGHACKIYLKDRLTENRFQKVALMVEKKINISGVCWPLAMARNSHSEFVGYLMPAAGGKPMQKSMFVKPLLEKYFPVWSRKNLVQLSITWLEKIVALHSFNILVGDVNPLNVLIKTDQELYFVDTDSYQIDDFPCPVGMANFTAPEIQGKNFAAFMRSPEHEYFAIATLLFMILLPGKPPYSHQGGGDTIENIQKGDFSYPLGEKSNKKTPDGPWRFIWSHLPYKTKEAFYNNFVNQERISPDRWLDLMRNYKYALEKGHLDPDGESDKLFPTRFKAVSDYAKEKYDAEDSSFVSFTCAICGNPFQLNATQAEKMKNISKICRDCYQVEKMKTREEERRKRETGYSIYCVNCGNQFFFSTGEWEYYQGKGLDPPKRCKQCRSNNRESNKSSTDQTEYGSDSFLSNILKSIFN